MNSERRRLRRAIDERWIVRVERDDLVPGERLHGFALDSDRDWTLLLLVTDSMPDGYTLIRTRDVTDVRTRGKRDVDRRWQKRHGSWPPPAPQFTLAAPRELLEQAAAAYPLVTVYQEELDPDIALIGRAASFGKKALRLQEIDCTAQWRRTPTKIRYQDLTRLEFADHYQRVLTDLGGKPPRPAGSA